MYHMVEFDSLFGGKGANLRLANQPFSAEQPGIDRPSPRPKHRQCRAHRGQLHLGPWVAASGNRGPRARIASRPPAIGVHRPAQSSKPAAAFVTILNNDWSDANPVTT